jgi:hypothetical protein
MVYFAIKGNTVIHHTDPLAMQKWDKVKPQKKLTDAEFLAFGNLARVIDGKIFFGKTQKEKADDEANERIRLIDTELQSIDAKMGGRSMRGAILALKNIADISANTDISKLQESESRAIALRNERREVLQLLDLPY